MSGQRHFAHVAVNGQRVGRLLDPFVVETENLIGVLNRIADLSAQHRRRVWFVHAYPESNRDPEVATTTAATRPPEIPVFFRLRLSRDSAQLSVRRHDVDREKIVD